MNVEKDYVGIQTLVLEAKLVLVSFRMKVEERRINIENRAVISIVDGSVDGGFGFALRSFVASFFSTPLVPGARTRSGTERKRDFWRRTLAKTIGYSKSNREMTNVLEHLTEQIEKLGAILNCLEELLAALRDKEKRKNYSFSLRTAELVFLNAEDFSNVARNLVNTGKRELPARSSLWNDLANFERIALLLMSAVIREANVN